MKRNAIVLAAAIMLGGMALNAEETSSTAQLSADQGTQMTDMQSCPMMKGKKKDCGDMQQMWVQKAERFSDKSAKAETKGDTKLAELYKNCSTSAQNVADQMGALMKLKEQCMADSSCGAMMKKGPKGGCIGMTPKSCMRQAKKCEMMSEKLAKEATTDKEKALAELQGKMADQFKALAAAEESFGKAQSELRDYRKSLRSAKKASQDQDED